MTAIDKYVRLEAIGWWFEAGRQEGREVIVSFGDESLQITSLKDVPLTHWSLRATRRVGTRGEAVIYSADPEQQEILEIEDADMVRAISAVTSLLSGPATPPPRRRWLWRGLGVAIILALLGQSPPLIYSVANTLTPPSRLIGVSTRLQERLQQKTAGECQGWQGRRALAAFSRSLLPDPPPALIVLDGLDPAALALPDGRILLSRATIEAATPESLAALVALAWGESLEQAPQSRLIKALGPLGALRYIVSGRFPALLPDILPEGDHGSSYIAARDYLLESGISPAPLQLLAQAEGIGLPLPPATLPAFEFESFDLLQNICAE